MSGLVAIAGWFGSGNFGDELLLDTLVGTIRRADPEREIRVISADPARVQQDHGLAGVRLPTFRQSTLSGLVECQRLLACSDILVIGPGTVFQERSPNLSWPGTLPLFIRLTAMSRGARTPVAICGAAVREGGSFAGDLALRLLGRAAAHVGVRDRFSAEVFGARAVVMGDVAFAAVERVNHELPRTSAETVCLSFRPLNDDREALVASRLVQVVDALGREGMSSLFVPMSVGHSAVGEDDLTVFDRYFRGSMDIESSHFVHAPFDVRFQGLIQRLGESRLTIATRLHAAVCAIMAGVPTVGICYERKVAETLRDVGLDEYAMSPDDSAAKILEACRRALAARDTDFAAARLRAKEYELSVKSFISEMIR